LNIVSHTYTERYYFRKLLNSINFIDAIREFVPHNEKLYSWWSYRNKDWELSNKGRRLDHILLTEPLKAHLYGYDIFKSARNLAPTSDHVPVMIDLKI
jgi:exodeoxyribonuclease-3